LPATHAFDYRQAGLLLLVGACFGCAEGVPIGPDDVVILQQLPDDGGVREITPPVETTPNPAPGAVAPAPSPGPIPPVAAPVVAPDAGTVDAGPAADAGG
jgi:hypothetical protein